MISFLKNKTAKSLITYILKLSLGFGLFIYFLKSGKIHFNFFADSRHLIGFLILSGIQIMIFVLSNYRWHLVTKTLKLKALTLKECLYFSWIGLFFASFLPGIIASDFSKIHYLRQQGHDTKELITSVVIDRAVALISVSMLFGISIIAMLWALSLIEFFGLLVLSLCLLYGLKQQYKNKRFLSRWELPPVRTVIISFITFILKALSLVYIIFLAKNSFALSTFYVSLAGQLFEIFPLSPANLGVGHFAFNYVYSFIQDINGAQIYNFYFIVKLFFKFTGFIGWILVRKKTENSNNIA